MAKRSFRGRPKKAKAGASQQNLMAQMQQMQQEMADTQAQLADETIVVTAGGGAISITISGHQRVQAIAIDPEIIDPEDAEMLQDMLVAAVNAAIEQSQAMAAQKMEGVTGGLDINNLLGGM